MIDTFSESKTARNIAAFVVACVAGLLGAAAAPPAAQAGVVKARPAADFVDMFGVVVHISRNNGVLQAADPAHPELDASRWPAVREAIIDAGFRNVRTTLTKRGPDDEGPLADEYIRRVGELYHRGIRFNFRIDTTALGTHSNEVLCVLNTGEDDTQCDETIDNMLSMTKEVAVDAILSFEGPNEYNSNWETTPDWAARLEAFMSLLKERVTADPAIDEKPIVAPSIWMRKVNDYQSMAALNVAAQTNKGNLHNYNGGRQPDYDLSNRIGVAQIMTGAQPIWVTEYGYRTDGPDHVSEAAKAKYLPRYAGLLFNDPRVERAFNFQIVDEWPAAEKPDKSWGLLDNDLKKRPAFYAMKNTFALLGDGGGDFGTGSLDYVLNGASSAIRHFLVQKSNGRFYLGIWQEAESFSQETGNDVDVAPKTVKIAIATPVLWAKTYLPTVLDESTIPNVGISPVCLDPGDAACANGTYGKVQSIVLPVPDQLVIVEIALKGDAFSPSVPGDVTAVQGKKRRVTVAWDASTDNVGVVSYRVYESGVLKKTGPWRSYAFAGRKDWTYELEVSAVDAAGNASARSQPVVLTVE